MSACDNSIFEMLEAMTQTKSYDCGASLPCSEAITSCLPRSRVTRKRTWSREARGLLRRRRLFAAPVV